MLNARISAIAILAFTGATCAQVPSFSLIHPPPGAAEARAAAISADGYTVIGTTLVGGVPGPRDFVWTFGQGTVAPAPMPGGTTTHFRALSADGSIIAGWGDSAVGTRAFRWARAGGYQVLPLLPGATSSNAGGISADGSIVVGSSGDTHTMPWRWTSGTGTQPLPGADWTPAAMSADGAVIVGTTSNIAHMVRLTAAGLQDFPPPQGYWEARPLAISADGGTVVGTLTQGMPVPYSVAFRWTSAGGYEVLHPTFQWDVAAGASRDGALVVGRDSLIPIDGYAAAWTRNRGRLDLTAVLRAAGEPVPPGTLGAASGASADGRWIAGWGAPGGNSWIAQFPPGFGCYVNCDGSISAPVLNILDFICYLRRFGAGDPYANCDGSSTPPIFSVADFSCFLQKFAAGCP